ncbi:unnamed protein product [Symbiodinium sp. CCMP2592]|nr:unnamed protein product [Symbiodinium sp. CCMP2592]
MPACRLCSSIHIESGACCQLGGDSLIRAPIPDEQAAEIIQAPPAVHRGIFEGENAAHTPLVLRVQFQQKLHDWESWLKEPAVRQELSSHCVLCNMWISSYKHVKQHFNKVHASQHPTLMQRVLKLSLTFKSHLTRDRSCLWCHHKVGAPGRHVQQCTPLVQLTPKMFGENYQMGNDELEIFASCWGDQSTSRPRQGDPNAADRSSSLAGAIPAPRCPSIRAASNVLRGTTRNETDGTLATLMESGSRVAKSQEVLNQAQKSVATAENKTKMVTAGWMTPEGGWTYRTWDHSEKRLCQDTQKDPLSHDEAVSVLTQLQKHVTGDVIQKFASTVGLQKLEEQGSNVATFQLEVSLRGSMAQEIYDNLSRLAGCSILSLVGCGQQHLLPQAFWETSEHPREAMRLIGFKLLGWSEPRRQHDVAEFIDHLHPKLVRPLSPGHWETRGQTAEGFDRQVQASVAKCIQLPTDPANPTHNVQDLVQLWHQQAELQAFAQAPPWAFLQLPRFRYNERGRAGKLLHPYTLPHVIRLPVFTSADSLAVQWIAYRTTACIQHHGARPTAGHYTTAIFRKSDLWQLDDEKSSRLHRPEQLDHLSTNMYIIAVARMPDTTLQPSSDSQHTHPRTVREEDLNWIASQLFLLKLQVSGIAEGLEALQCAHNRLQDELRVLTAQMDKQNHNKVPKLQCFIMLDSLDD